MKIPVTTLRHSINTQLASVGCNACWLLLVWALLSATACNKTAPGPNIGNLYTRSALEHHRDRSPIIVIPGVLGSRLKDFETNRMVWGAFLGNYADPGTDDGARLIALPLARGRDLNEVKTSVLPDGVLGQLQVEFFGFPIHFNAYNNILQTLGVGGYRDQELSDSGAVDYGDGHFTCFQFPYDWRRDISYNAAKLHEFILQKKQYVEKELKTRYGIERDVKFDIIAHSMGGLLARYYLRYGPQLISEGEPLPTITWEGAQFVEEAILIASPDGGSIEVLKELVSGIKLGPTLPEYRPAILGTMPAIYQILPRERHGAYLKADSNGEPFNGIFDAATWEQLGWGLLSPKEDEVLKALLPDIASKAERRSIALEHVRKCLLQAKRFHLALDVPADLPPGLSLSIFVGDAMPTPSAAEITPETGRLQLVRPLPGDGTVTRASALLDERMSGAWSPELKTPIDWTQIVFLFSGHLELTRDPVFVDNILFTLLERP